MCMKMGIFTSKKEWSHLEYKHPVLYFPIFQKKDEKTDDHSPLHFRSVGSLSASAAGII